jgi:hypothetical protein
MNTIQKKHLNRFNFLTFGLLLFTAFTFLVACNSTPASVKKAKVATDYGAFNFTEKLYDFGKINNGDVVKHTFKFYNTGKSPLIIHDISTSCGCTIVKWSTIPVKPAQSGEITVQFSKKSDPGIHIKDVIIKANTEDPYTVIHIKAFIKQA